jgi:hypothetical protein
LNLKILGLCVAGRSWVLCAILIGASWGAIWPEINVKMNNAIRLWGPKSTVDGVRLWNVFGALMAAALLMYSIISGRFFCRS